MNKKGFTLIEIIVSISLISIVVIFLFQIIITIKNLNDSEVNKTNNQMTVAIITREVEKDLNSFGLEEKPNNECDTTQKNIIPATAENIKCIKLIYRSINVKNNEGYIIYYKNKNKSFLAYKRGKGNIIETQTVREISIEPNEDVIISTVNSEDNVLSSLKMTVPISKDNKKYDLVINYVDSNSITEGEETIATTLSKLDKESNGLEVDDTDDQNLRYVGAKPNNYISFNDETWRIIGVFNVYNTETNQNEKLVKIIRNESLGSYSWDTSDESVNLGYGINEWSQAKLMYELNCENQSKTSLYCSLPSGISSGYLTTKTNSIGSWYNDTNNIKSGSYDYNKNIGEYIDKIASVRWNLGGIGGYMDVKSQYSNERGTDHVSNTSDGVTRTDYWDGKVGLMYPSDYGYASTDTTCRGQLSSTNCKNNNWLFKEIDQWTLTPFIDRTGFCFSLIIGSNGNISNNNASAANAVHPVLYLKSSVKITGGTGTATDPYTID